MKINLPLLSLLVSGLLALASTGAGTKPASAVQPELAYRDRGGRDRDDRDGRRDRGDRDREGRDRGDRDRGRRDRSDRDRGRRDRGDRN
ncbi:hypothetical protein DSO57_1037966 [Entomophthora muscae]|uniref:Uncharacterized protein n=1 Tax=Entomophthora muscae TaxID=34485 RepID=A0ACC2RPT7_9FUNG|nr:hypothetical protein DSO57_1037966 [Entomophthora muscae]